MTSVESRKLVFNKVFKILTEFYSFIILRKLRECDLIDNFRSIENLIKLCTKINADINFLNNYEPVSFCSITLYMRTYNANRYIVYILIILYC